MSPVAKRSLSALLGLAAVGYLARVLWLKRDELDRTLDFGWDAVLVLFTLAAMSHLQRFLEVNFMLRRLNARESRYEGYIVTGAALILNYLPLGAGSVGRAVIARRRHALPYTSFVAVLAVGSIVNGTVASLCGFFATLRLAADDPKLVPIVVAFGAIAVGGFVALSLPSSLAPGGSSFAARHLRMLSEGLVMIRDRGRGILVLGVFSFAKLVLNTARLWICFKALGIVLAPLTVMLIGSTAILASLVNLAPGNLGLRELLLGATAAAGGGSSTVGMAAASLERAVMFGYALLVGIPCLLLVRRLSAPETAPETGAATTRS